MERSGKYMLVWLLLAATYADAQHHRHADTARVAGKKKVVADSAAHVRHAKQEGHIAPMSHGFSLNLPMTRNGSGTGWLPDSTPMYGYMLHRRKWMYMFHGNIFARYNRQDLFGAGTRGGEESDVVSWFMAMGQRRLGSRGLLRFSAMFSADRLFGGNGYPLLFQTGETWKGNALVDRQHPHDLVSELSAGYSYAINDATDVFVYAAYPGEPALGSVAFMHRVSSLYGPDAPLSHHWNDGTHITFGVITGGFRFGKFKIEASHFTGREPDENRYDFDRLRPDSYSGRLSYNPSPYWALQVSQGFVTSPESIRPHENVKRTTASAVYSRPLGHRRFVNATALWGLNLGHAAEHALLAEGVWVAGRFAMQARFEHVQKSVEELGLDAQEFAHHALFPVNALTLGTSYDVLSSAAVNAALGGQFSIYAADKRLSRLYGQNPLSVEVFLRLYPPRMR